MGLDITIHNGLSDKPVIVFIHGLAMDKNFWLDPLETKAFARNVPLKFLAAKKPGSVSAVKGKKITIGRVPEKIYTLWDALKDEGYSLVCWSQRRPVGPISAAIKDLEELMSLVKKKFRTNSVAFVCHSRGGLIARKFMESERPEIRALITIASPHRGSSLSKIGKYIEPLTKPLKTIVPKNSRGAVSKIIKNLQALVDGKALKELMPGSAFIVNLADKPVGGVRYLSFGGRKPALLKIYRWEKADNAMRAKLLLTLLDSLLKFIPSSKVPDELTPGKGDFMVAARSSVMPWASEHYNLQANHFTITWNKKVIEKTLGVLRNI